jgi:ParB family chromosome partitioning protein
VLGLIENIQRENLSPIEEAYSYQNLMQLQAINQTQLAKQLGKSQSSIANKIRLLNLPIQVMNEIDNKKITERHGRALLALKDEPGLMLKMARQISQNDLTVVKTEIEIKKLIHDKKQTNINSKTKIIEDNNVKVKLAVNTIKKSIANPIEMIKATGLKINVNEKKIGGKHQIIIEIEE